MIPMLEAMNIPTILLSFNDEANQQTKDIISSEDINGPVAIIIRKTHLIILILNKTINNTRMSREDAIIHA